jgi:Tetratricopeptide repeat
VAEREPPLSAPPGPAHPSEPPRSLRWISAPPPPADSDPPSGSSFDGEDFLYHLYRGSELLQDNCVAEAKEELERALRLQPRDIEGQGLLGVVYFRLGLYPRAIEIYEEITRACPNEISPRVNLALCHFKTGRPDLARELLEDVTRRVPDHVRAWGYLGLVHERLGDPEKALTAFERAGQPHLVRRMQELLEQQGDTTSDSAPPEQAELRRAAADAVEELDASPHDSAFSRASDEIGVARLRGRWRAVEPGQAAVPKPPHRRRPPSLTGRFGPAVPAVLEASELEGAVARPSPQPELTASALLERSLIPAPPPEVRVSIAPSGLAVLRVPDAFAVRGDAVRAAVPDQEPFRSSALFRRVRGRENGEPFGSGTAAWYLLEGSGLLVLAPAPARRLYSVRLEDDFMYVREQHLVAFASGVRFENGRLPGAGAEPVPMVQLSGTGSVLVELHGGFQALPVSAERPASFRLDGLVGWTGRLLGRPVDAEHSPTHTGGFVAFNGDGAVFLDVG